MEIRNDLPEGVGICQGCGEIYTDELTLSRHSARYANMNLKKNPPIAYSVTDP